MSAHDSGETYFAVGPKARLRVLRHHPTPEGAGGERPVVFVPGWASTTVTWRYFVPALARTVPVLYFETREKASSVLDRRARYDVYACAADLAAFIDHEFGSQPYMLAGASTGAFLALEAYNLLNRKPDALALVLPQRRVPIPLYIHALRLVPVAVLKRLRSVAVHFLRDFPLTRMEVSQQEGLFAVLTSADAYKLRRSAIALRPYRLDNSVVQRVRTPTLIVAASRDRFHSWDDARTIHAILASNVASDCIDLATFTGAHSSRAGALVGSWLQKQPWTSTPSTSSVL